LKKLIIILSCLICIAISVYNPVYAASVSPQLFPGNDSNPADYTPPPGYIHYEIPGSGAPGTYTVRFNATGAVDPNGPYSFTVVVGTAPGESFTKVLSWSSNFPVFAVIVKGGDAFNLYQYNGAVQADTNLVSPNNASGNPANVNHVSIVFNPEDLPPQPPTTTPSPTPTMTPTSTPTPTPFVTCIPTPKPPTPGPCFNIIFFGIIFIALIIAFFLIGQIIGCIICHKDRRIDCYKGCRNHPPGNTPPDGNPPGNNPPGNKPPDGNPPGNNPPGNNPPGHNPPGHNPPGHNPPGNNPPGHNPPGNNPPGHNPPCNNSPGYDPQNNKKPEYNNDKTLHDDETQMRIGYPKEIRNKYFKNF
jgi:hypothetical protein